MVAEEPPPVMKGPLAIKKPATEHPTLGSGCLEDSQEDDKVEVHTPSDDPDDW